MPVDMSPAERERQVFSTCGTKERVVRVPAMVPIRSVFSMRRGLLSRTGKGVAGACHQGGATSWTIVAAADPGLAGDAPAGLPS
ncbi:hypothetical protein JCM19379_12940 [Methyloparacoccus murrellii]